MIRNYWILINGTLPDADVQCHCHWFPGYTFGTCQMGALECARCWAKHHPGDYVAVIAVIGKIPREQVESSNYEIVRQFRGSHTTPEGASKMGFSPEIAKPLNLKREDVVAKLQENLDKEQQDREQLEARERAARIAVQQFVTDHEDEIVQWIGAGAPGGFGSGSWEEIAKAMERFFEDHDYKPKSAKKSKRENDLEKFVRVLSMATDSSIEVQPHQPIYELL